MDKIKISELPVGMVIWKGNEILGVTQFTLPIKYYDFYCKKINGNPKDYEIIEEK